MSSVTFHSEHDGTADLRGPERAWWGSVCADVAVAVLPRFPRDVPEHIINPDGPIPALQGSRAYDFHDRLRLTLAHTDSPAFQLPDVGPLSNFDLLLNTVLAMGSDPLALMARLHGQVELHCYVEGPDRAWLAQLITDGCTAGLMRDGVGWDRVHALLVASDSGPVVCSYSVTEGWPDQWVADWEPPFHAFDEDEEYRAHDLWYELDPAEQWRRALAGIRDPARGLQLAPDRLRLPFGHTRSLLDLRAHQLGAAATVNAR